MQNTELITKSEHMMAAIHQFHQAYLEVLSAWDESVLRLNDGVPEGIYPFDCSFDELGISEWTETVTAVLKDRVASAEYKKQERQAIANGIMEPGLPLEGNPSITHPEETQCQ